MLIGKSFCVRQKAAAVFSDSSNYALVPVNRRTLMAHDLIAACRAQLSLVNNVDSGASTLPLVLHFDVASTATASVANALFAVTIFGVLADSMTSEQFFYNPANTLLCIELAAGKQFGCFSQLCEVFPSHKCVAKADLFVLSRSLLRVGMGPEYNAAVYHDGYDARSNPDTTFHLDSRDVYHQARHANAFDRAAYVVHVLDILDKNGNTYPIDVHGASVAAIAWQHNHADKDEQDAAADPLAINSAGRLLFHASGLSRYVDECSFWGLWSFINMLYWQLSELNHYDSPVYLACLPDVGIKLMTLEFDIAMKARVRGELTSFLIKTAREFAFSSLNASENVIEDGRRIIGITVENMSNVLESRTKDINLLFWRRAHFDNDNYPGMIPS